PYSTPLAGRPANARVSARRTRCDDSSDAAAIGARTRLQTRSGEARQIRAAGPAGRYEGGCSSPRGERRLRPHNPVAMLRCARRARSIGAMESENLLPLLPWRRRSAPSRYKPEAPASEFPGPTIDSLAGASGLYVTSFLVGVVDGANQPVLHG